MAAAGTDFVADILFLQRRHSGQEASGSLWDSLAELVPAEDGGDALCIIIAPCGRRTTPTRSVMPAMWSRAWCWSGLIAFVASGEQAVDYHIDTWHHAVRVLDRPGRFSTLMWTTGEKEDDEAWATLAEPISIVE